MANAKTLHKSFAGGEVTPEFYGRIDDAKFQSGLATCRNFIVLPHGPVTNRAGTAFVRETKYSGATSARLIPFTYSSDQTMVIEAGVGYFRFHTQGGTLLQGTPSAWSALTTYTPGDQVSYVGVNYTCRTTTITTPPLGNLDWHAEPATGEYEIFSDYAEADLPQLKFVQSADVLTIVHPGYAPAELRREGATKWALTTIAFASQIDPPTSVTATPTGAGATTYSYVVTATDGYGQDESVASSPVATCTNNLLTTGNYNTITFVDFFGPGIVRRYRIYKESNGLYGYIGETDSFTFIDDNIAADVSRTPPLSDDPFATDWPGAVTYFEQRRCFAGTTLKPQNLWMTKSGTESNLTYSLPTRDDDSIRVRMASREANTIRHMIPLGDLVMLTASSEWRVSSGSSDAITPTSIQIRPQSYVGANHAQPAIVNNTAIYAAARGGHVREVAYNFQAGGYTTGDLSLRATHLFDQKNVVELAYSKAPYPIVWAVSDDGNLLGLTYVPEQQIGAWHQHDTDGVFESICCVAEGNEDVLYCIVKRTIDGNDVRYVERMQSRLFGDQADAFFVDCGATYSGAPADTISGLDHLEGAIVSILADGAVHPQLVVVGGAITLEIEASTVTVGLPITAEIKTLPLTLQVDGAFGQGRAKNVSCAFLRVSSSCGVWVGPSDGRLIEYKHRTTEPYGSPPALVTGEIRIALPSSWTTDGALIVRQTDPLPLTVLSMALEVALGG